MLAKALLMRKKNSDGNLINPDVILPAQGWMKQEDGSFYTEKAYSVLNPPLWTNTENYTGQLNIKFSYKYNPVSADANPGVFLTGTYTDNTIIPRKMFRPADRNTEYVDVDVITPADKAIASLIWLYGHGDNSTWIKDLIITKV